jgi:hypothetical protein
MDDLDLELDDSVVFELPAFEDVEAFHDRLRPRWDGWTHVDEQVWLLTARVGAQGDLAALLRTAQELLRELGRDGIRFCLDGRVYVLDASPRRATDLAARSK